MSILNCHLEADRALLLVDTAVTLDGSSDALTECSKAVPLIHAGAVLAGRGRTLVLMDAQVRCLATYGDFDRLASILPAMLAESYKAAATLQAKLGYVESSDFPLQEIEIVLAGYSPAMDRVRVLVCTQVKKEEGFSVTELEPGQSFAGPGFPDLLPLRAPVTHEQLAQLAVEQARRLRVVAPRLVVGGRLIEIEVRKGGLSVAESAHPCP